MNITHAVKEEIKGCKLEAIFNRQKELMEKYHHIEAKSGLCQTSDCPVNLDDKRGQARLKDFAWRATEEVAEALEVLPKISEDVDKLKEYDKLLARYKEMEDEDNKEEIETVLERLIPIKDSMESNILHLREELVDSLHFFTEFTILAGLSPEDLITDDEVQKEQILDTLEDTGLDILDFWVAGIVGNGLIESNIEVAGMRFITSLGICCNFLKNKPWKQTQMVTDKVRFKNQVRSTWLAMIRLLISAGLDSHDIAELYLKKSQVNKFRQRTNY